MIKSKEPTLLNSLIPVFVLMILLAVNIFGFEGEMLGGYSNQYILLFAGIVAFALGIKNQIRIRKIWAEVKENLISVIVPIGILLMVGALTGTWLISGIIPAMVYYGLEILNPEIFLPLSVVISAFVSIATGSSWTTSATVGIALISIGSVLGISPGMIAGAVISGAYFGDKMSPLSDTTNLAPAMAGTDLYTHIKYMSITTVPSILVTLVVFIIINFNIDITGKPDVNFLLDTIENTFNITPLLFIVPLIVIVLILLKTKPLIALGSGVFLAIVFSIYFQPQILNGLGTSKTNSILKSVFIDASVEVDDSKYKNVFSEKELKLIENQEDIKNLFSDDDVEEVYSDFALANIFVSESLSSRRLDENVSNLKKLITIKKLKKLFNSGGMNGMLWTILLIISAMIFGGIMDGVGALAKITKELLKLATSIFGLFSATVASCLGLNTIASDQYLAIVIPGKMFKKAFKEKGLAPENLSRTLEDSGTVTSVLIPWNTCGAYQSGVLGVSVEQYFFYAVFNWISPIVTLVFAYFMIKIRRIVN